MRVIVGYATKPGLGINTSSPASTMRHQGKIHRFLRAGSDDHLISREIQVWIIPGNAFAQCRQSCLQRVTVLLFLNDAHCFPANHIGSWQIRLAQTETDVAWLRAIRDLTNRTPFDTAQECWWLKLFQGSDGLVIIETIGRARVKPSLPRAFKLNNVCRQHSWRH